MVFQERLREQRKERGETRVQVAEAVGIISRHYQQFEAGSILSSFHNLFALADHFGVSMDYLAGRMDRREVNR